MHMILKKSYLLISLKFYIFGMFDPCMVFIKIYLLNNVFKENVMIDMKHVFTVQPSKIAIARSNLQFLLTTASNGDGGGRRKRRTMTTAKIKYIIIIGSGKKKNPDYLFVTKEILIRVDTAADSSKYSM